MTPEQKEIRDAERKAMAEVRRWKREANKEWIGLPHEERMEFFRKESERLRAEGLILVEKIAADN